jgi:hypothetical protein
LLNNSVERQLFRKLQEDESLKSILSGVTPEELTAEQLTKMYMWTRPLIGSDDPDSIKARSQFCGIDGI